jgi:ankyrin repeat protein
MASREGHAGVVKVLLEAGADKDLEDEVRTQLRILCPSRDKMLATLIRQ